MNRIITSRHFEPWRLLVFIVSISTVFGYFVITLFSLQIIRGQEFVDQANENRTTLVSVPTDRGIIYDRNGYVLARNIPSYNVVITPAYLPADAGAVQEVYRQLSELIGVPVSFGETTDENVRLFKPCETDLGLTEIVYIQDTNAPFTPVRVKCNVDSKTAMIVTEKESDWPGVSVEVIAVRDYPTGSLTSEIIGFLGPIPASQEDFYKEQGFISGRDKVGYAGVESTLQDSLGGRNGERTVEVDVAGKEIRDLKDPLDAIPGDNIKLTVDVRLQNAAKTALIGEIDFWNKYLNKIRSSNGVVAAINPRTGEVLALVSYPTYENNRMARIIPGDYYEQLLNDPNRPLFNHAISAEHPPGSVYKMATAIGALNEGVITPQKELMDPGKITITQKFTENEAGTPRDFVCYEEAGHGMINFLRGVALSCDVYFYKIGGGFKEEDVSGLGIWRMQDYAKALGYGVESGIELPGEEAGLVPDPTWKRITVGENWSTGDTYIATIGQGYVLATPLQVLESFATIINDGIHMKPTIVKEVINSDGSVKQPFKPVQLWDITKDPMINIYDENSIPTGEKKTVERWTIDLAMEGMREVVVDGTATDTFEGMTVATAGKTGTAEYCDNIAQAQNLCQPGSWPAHAWYVGYAPFDNPEIAVVAFVYNGGEGASVAGPIVRRVLDAYFELKAVDAAKGLR
ncbi:MAG: penicillin-binding protein 2 [Anaerolineaceae bacterium]